MLLNLLQSVFPLGHGILRQSDGIKNVYSHWDSWTFEQFSLTLEVKISGITGRVGTGGGWAVDTAKHKNAKTSFIMFSAKLTGDKGQHNWVSHVESAVWSFVSLSGDWPLPCIKALDLSLSLYIYTQQ